MNNGKKRIILGLIALAVAFAVLLGLQAVDAKLPAPAAAAAAAETEGKYTPGTYTGTADGFGGPVSVTLTVGGDGRISNVSITGDRETPSVGGAAIPDLAEAVLSAQGGDVDVVSGATFTSNAVRTAASAAAAEAMGAAVQSGPKAADGNRYIPGTYTGSSKGFGGDITVTVTVDENSILDVNIDGSHETENIGSFAVSMLGDSIMAEQTPNVDVITGATVSSGAILRALKDALTQAGADLASFPSAEKTPGGIRTYETMEVDIVVIGAGGAGMTAAIKAKQAGKNVIILEKMPYVGGNTTKATGGMNAAETHYQKEQGIEDSVDLFAADTMKGGHDINDPDLVRTLAQESAGAIDWLDSIGADLPKISFSGGASVNRIHAPADGSAVGNYLVDKFSEKLKELGVEVMLNTTATELIMEDSKIAGVKAEGKDANYTIKAKAVILATGGFGANLDMIAGYRPDLQGTVTTNAPGATGDGIVMAQAVGAALVDIEQIQLHPTVEQTTSMLITESVRGDGAILVNQSGHRFTNELLTRDAVSAAELAQQGQYAYIIFDQHLRDNLKATEKYVKNGLTVQADTVEELAWKLNIYPYALVMTMGQWNHAVKTQNDEAFGRTTGMDNDLTTPPYYAIKIAPGIHHTMGGVKINTSAQVLDLNGDPIPGLFAAGEVTGGVHGGNRLGGNAVADIVIFGRIAAQSVLDYIK